MTTTDDRDALTQRYLEASAQDERRPAAHVGEAARAHARLLLDARATQVVSMAPPAAPANQPRWKISMFASVLLAGLAGFLILQLDHGTPQEKELVSGAPAPAAAPAVAPAPDDAAKAAPVARDKAHTEAADASPEPFARSNRSATLGDALSQPQSEATAPQRARVSRAALNTPDAAGRTPLMLAVISGNAGAVQRLLAAGANRALVDNEGLTALQHARRLGLEHIARLIEAAP